MRRLGFWQASWQRRSLLIFGIVVSIAGMLTVAGAGRPLRLDDFDRFRSVGDIWASPDGHWIVYTIRKSDAEKDESTAGIWRVPTTGGTPRPLSLRSRAPKRS